MNIDTVDWAASVLQANFGDGYRADAVVGAPHGLFRWKLSSGCLSDTTDPDYLIDSLPWFQYYFNFFRSHTTGTQRIFALEFRGGKYLATFADTKMSADTFTSTLFSSGVEIKQARVSGFDEDDQGAVGGAAGVTFDGAPVTFGATDVTYTR